MKNDWFRAVDGVEWLIVGYFGNKMKDRANKMKLGKSNKL